ncbi:hypothetical protein PPYR_06684 [Photinus pyralis]|uniref:Mitochondrial import receptor subunit TOM70 n=1 Tax=Photinus pyralis TaxID=7054 RepID=A0A1Y1K1D7_PHOPY|nr:mitochondrial import receptor subunit TOM70 [Photinus pyralis]KAB0798804.1 hypothetical protein PPYR_06684 [Photinus pyralis]
MSSVNSGGSTPFPKWQIALALGATGAIGLGYWYLRQQSKSVSAQKPNLKDVKSLSIEDKVANDEKGEETPFRLSQKFKNEGNVLFKKGKYDEAISLYNKAIEICPKDQRLDLATYYQNRAAAYEQLKKWSSVIADCTVALEHNGKYEKALFRRAKAYEAIKDWENCLDDITAVCLLQSFQNQNALILADRVLKELGKQHAAEAMKNKKPILPSKQFIKTYFMSFSEDPVYKLLLNTEQPIGDSSSGFLKAKIAFATENFEDIIPACTEEINSSESESHYIFEALSLRASFYLLSGSHQLALDDFKTVIDAADADVKLRVNTLIKRASLRMQLEQPTECLQDFATAVELAPNNSDIYHHRGQINLLMDNTEEARSDFDKAVELNPKFAIAVVQKCYADYRYAMLTQNGDMLINSLASFLNATKQFSAYSEVFVLYGQVLTERQEYAEAEKTFIKALEIEPNNATILVHRGLLALQWTSDMKKAIDLISSAIQLDEKCEFAYETLGTIEVQRGNLVIAIELFNKAIGLARTENEMTHLFSLRDAAISQLKVTTKLGIGPQLLKSDV